MSRLNVIEVESTHDTKESIKQQRKEVAINKFENLWKQDPEQFNPLRNAMGCERIKRTWDLLLEYALPAHKHAVDLGCGYGIITQRLCHEGALVHAVDISPSPLKRLQEKRIQNLVLSQDYMPRTSLQDNAYDLVFCTDLIAYLSPDEFRLFFSELSRIIKNNGYLICSTPLDINSEDALQRFVALAETEFKIEKYVFSYHHLSIRLFELLKVPARFIKARKDNKYRKSEITQRKGVAKWWFQLNSTAIPFVGWNLIQQILNPLINKIEQSQWLLAKLETISRIFWNDTGISHVIFLGTRRPLTETVTDEEIPRERKQKREVWE